MPTWPQTRLLITLAVVVLIIMEPVSWMTAPISPCIVNPENYGAYYANHNECPTFHVFLIVLVARVFEHFGDPNWVVADFTVVLALSTICLWVVTWRAGVRQSRDTVAFIGETRRIGEAQVRAYVDITQVRLILLMPQIVGAGETTLIRIFAKNTGQSPARNFLWHPSIQFIGSLRPGVAAEQKLGANWREMSGVGIAAGQEHDDGAMLGRAPLRDEQPTISAVIRVRIDFEFDDVFGGHHVGETYFAGIFQRKIMGFDQTDLGSTQWQGALRRTNALRDWDSVAKTERA